MALVNTTLTSAITASQLTIPLASTVGIAVNQSMMIDGEFMYVASNITPSSVKVRWRGHESVAMPHDVNAAVVVAATASDLPALGAGLHAQRPLNEDVVTLGQDQTITPPAKNTTYMIAKGSAAAITLAAATAAQVSLTLTFMSTTAFAHTITYAPGFLAGANTIATLTARVGATMVVKVAANGIFAVIDGAPGQVTLSV